MVVLFGKALPSLYRPWGTAGAEVKVLCGKWRAARHAGNRSAQRDRGVVRAYCARPADRGALVRREACPLQRSAQRSMSWVTSTTPRLVTKKRF
jgi:hypothetical protein